MDPLPLVNNIKKIMFSKISENVFDIPLKVETLPTSFGSTSHLSSFLNSVVGVEVVQNV